MSGALVLIAAFPPFAFDYPYEHLDIDYSQSGRPNMISGLFFVNQRGDVILSRLYRDDVSTSAAAAFRVQVITNKNTGSSAPVRSIEGNTFLYTRHKDIFLVAVTRSNANSIMVFRFLYAMVEVLKGYFGPDFDEESLRDNFTLVYELLDEVLDFGYPQTCAFDVLKLYINLGKQQTPNEVSEQKKITSTITGKRDWRREGIVYKKNEIFIDVLESVNILVSTSGNLLRSDVTGKVVLKALLSGMPDCKLGLNDKLQLESNRGKSQKSVELEDVSFHRCVQLGKFDTDRTITFVPPDGEFELMRYRISSGIQIPFRILPVVEERGPELVSADVKVVAPFSEQLNGVNLVIKIPTPPSTARARIVSSIGRAKYQPEQRAIVWRIRKFPGKTEATLHADISLIRTTTKKQWSKPPITAEFQVPMFTSSGLQVRSCKVHEKSNPEVTKWVRYVTRAGQYQVRI
eukprot:gb/GECG01016223.1/.p1 GENE.gb/GECG01016223.1/~~gb/GECG01016223.1/.p1  ORF type:complete len:460 (+),score=37.21 gb/GECG01016223.1/:1-1380(+)